MKYLYIVFLQQWLWHPELLPLRSLFIMNTLLASLLVPELFCIQTVFYGFLPFTCLEVVIFNNVFTLGRKNRAATRNAEKGFPKWGWDSHVSAQRPAAAVENEFLNWYLELVKRTLAHPWLDASLFITIALNWTFFSSSILYWVGGYWCKPCRCLSVVLVCDNLLFPRYRVEYVDA